MMVDKEDVKDKTKKIYEVLPRLDDRRCGYKTCGEFAYAVARGNAPCDGCVSGGPDVAVKVCDIMGTRIPEQAASRFSPVPELPRPGLGAGRGMGQGMGRGPGRGRGIGQGRGTGRGGGMGRGLRRRGR